MSDTPPYFGGSSVRSPVRRLQARTFKDLVDRYFNVAVQFPMTRADFLADPERDKKKDGPWVSPCDYPYEEEGPRGNAHARHLRIAFLDLDAGAFVKDIFESPKAVTEALWPFNFVLYTTAKHTPEAPRLKLAMDVGLCDPALLPRIVDYMCRQLAVPADFKGRTESTTLSQPQYRPLCFKGEPYTAILASRTDGVAFDPSVLPAEDEEIEEALNGRRFAAVDAGEQGEGLGLAYLPVPGITGEDLTEALGHVDPDCSRNEWMRVCAALRHQFTEEEEAQAAYDAFVEWSSKGTKFRGENDTFRMWKSLRPYAARRAPVTIRSLFKMAQDGGWTGGRVAQRAKDGVVEWIEACDNATTLMQEGAGRIAGMPLQSEILKDNLVTLLQKRIRDLSGERIEKRAILKDISRERKRAYADRKEADIKDNTPGWLRPFCYVSTDHKFYDFGRGVELSPAAFDLAYGRELMPQDAADVPVNGKPIMAPRDYAMNIVRLPTVAHKMYNPQQGGEDPYFEYDGKLYLNTFNPLSVPNESPENSEEAGELIRTHVGFLIAEPEYRELFLDFLAAQAQFPGRLIPWAPCIQSAEGVGKSMLGRIIGAYLGAVNVKLISPSVLKSEWNDWWLDALFHVFEEVHFPGEHREKVMNALKPMVSDPIITINKRNTTAQCRVPNYANCLGFTNYHNALHLKESNRRWFFIQSPIQTREQVSDLNATGHFDRLEKLLDEWAPGLRHWMLKRRISPSFPWHGPPPTTKYARIVIEESKNHLQQVIEDMLPDSNPFYGEDVVSLRHLEESVPASSKRDAYRVTNYLTLMGFHPLWPQPRPTLRGVRTQIWYRPSLCDESLGSPMDILEARLAALDEIPL